jgi:arsenite methyltransferase
VTAEPVTAPYEDAALRAATGGVLRPGGTALTERGAQLAGLQPGAVVVDVGCGTGGSLARLADRFGVRGIGVDPSASLLGAAGADQPSPPRPARVRARAEALPLDDGCADVVLAEYVLSLVPDPAAALAEFVRVLRPGERLLLTDLYARDPAGVARLRELPARSCLHGARGLAELTQLLNDAGLRLLHHEDHTPQLTALAVDLVWRTGSAQELWCPGPVPREQVADAVRAARPGYLLLLAQTPGG